jgi:tape measure domain-containing protein
MSGIVIEVDANTRKAQRNLEEVNTTVKSISQSVNSMADGFKSAFIAIGTTFAADQLLKYVEETTSSLQEMENKVALVVGKSNELYDTQVRLRNIADETNGTYRETVEVFTAMGRAMRNTNVDIDKLARSSKTIQQAVAISGSSAESSKAALTQLGQAFSSGVLRGEELNSVMEQTPRIAGMIADSMGVTLGQMRLIAAQGEITSEVIFKALADQAETINKEFKNIVPTLSTGFLKLKENAAYVFVEFDKGLALSEKLSKSVYNLSQELGKSVDKAYLLGNALRFSLVGFKNPLEDLLEPVKQMLEISIYAIQHSLDTIGLTRFITTVIEPFVTQFTAAIDIAIMRWQMFGKMLRSVKGDDMFYLLKPMQAIGEITALTLRNTLVKVSAEILAYEQSVTGRFRAFIIKEMRSFNIGGEIVWYRMSKQLIQNLRDTVFGTDSVAGIISSFVGSLFLTLSTDLVSGLRDLGETLAGYNILEKLFGVSFGGSKLARIAGNLMVTVAGLVDSLMNSLVNASETFTEELYYRLAEGLNLVLPKFAQIDMPIAFKVHVVFSNIEQSLDKVLDSLVSATAMLSKIDLFGALTDAASYASGVFVEVLNVLLHWITTFSELALRGDLTNWFEALVDKVQYYSDTLIKALAPIQAFGDAVIQVFFEIYDAVIAHSWWTDTIDEIIYTSATLWGNTSVGLKTFGDNVIDLFEVIYTKIGGVLNRIASLDLSKTMFKLNSKLYAYSPNLAGYAKAIEDSIQKSVVFLRDVFSNDLLFKGLRYSFTDTMSGVLSFVNQRFRAWFNTWPLALRQAFSATVMATIFSSLPKVIADGVIGGWLLASSIIAGTSLAITITANTFDKSLGVELGKAAGDIASGVVNGSLVDIPRLIGEGFAFFGNFMENFLTGLPYLGVIFSGIFKIASLFGSAPAVGLLGAWLFGGSLVRLMVELGVYRKGLSDVLQRQRSVQSFFMGTYTGNKTAGGQPTPLGKMSKAFFNDTNRTQSLAITGLMMDFSGMFNSLYKDNVIGHAIARGGLIWLALTGESGLKDLKTGVLDPMLSHLHNAMDRSPVWGKVRDKWRKEVTMSGTGGFSGFTQWMARELNNISLKTSDHLSKAFSKSNKINGGTFLQHLLLGRDANTSGFFDRFILGIESGMKRLQDKIANMKGGSLLNKIIPTPKQIFTALFLVGSLLSAMSAQGATIDSDNYSPFKNYSAKDKDSEKIPTPMFPDANPLQATLDFWESMTATTTQILLAVTAATGVSMIVFKEYKRFAAATYANIDRGALVMSGLSYTLKTIFSMAVEGLVGVIRLLYLETIQFRRPELAGLELLTVRIRSAMAVVLRFLAAVYAPQLFGFGAIGTGLSALGAYAAYMSGPGIALRTAVNARLEAAIIAKDAMFMKLDAKFAKLAYTNATLAPALPLLRTVDMLLQGAAAVGSRAATKAFRLPEGVLAESIASARKSRIAQYMNAPSYAVAAANMATGGERARANFINATDKKGLRNAFGVQETIAVLDVLSSGMRRFANTLKVISGTVDFAMKGISAAATYRATSLLMALYVIGNLVNAIANPKKRGEQEGFMGTGHSMGFDYLGNMPVPGGGEIPLSHLLIPAAIGTFMMKSAKKVGLSRAHDVQMDKITKRWERQNATAIAADEAATRSYNLQKYMFERSAPGTMVPPIMPTMTAPPRPQRLNETQLAARDARKNAKLEWERNQANENWMARQNAKEFARRGIGSAAEFMAMDAVQRSLSGVRLTQKEFLDQRHAERMAAGKGSVIRHNMPAVAGAGIAGAGLLAAGGYLGAKAGSMMSDGSQDGISMGLGIGAVVAGIYGRDIVTGVFNALSNTKNLKLFKWTWIPVALAAAWDSISTAHKTLWDRMSELWEGFKKSIGLKSEPKDAKTGLTESSMIEAAKLGLAPSFDISKIDMSKLSYSEETVFKDTQKRTEEALAASMAERLKMGMVADETANAASEALKALSRVSKEFAAKTKIDVEAMANQMTMLDTRNTVDPSRGTQALEFIGDNWKEALAASIMVLVGNKLRLLKAVGEAAPVVAGEGGAAALGQWMSGQGGNLVRTAVAFTGVKMLEEDVSTAVASGAIEGAALGFSVPTLYKPITAGVGAAIGAAIGYVTSKFSNRNLTDYLSRNYVQFPSKQGFMPEIQTTYDPRKRAEIKPIGPDLSEMDRARLEAENLRVSFVNSVKSSNEAYTSMDKSSPLALEYADRLSNLDTVYANFKKFRYEVTPEGATFDNKTLAANYYASIDRNIDALTEWTDAAKKQTEVLKQVSAREAIAKNEPGFWKPLGVTLDNLKDFQLTGRSFDVGKDLKARGETLVKQTQFPTNELSNANLFEKKRLADKRTYLQTLEADKYLSSQMAVTKLGNDINLGLTEELKYLSEDLTDTLRERIRKIQFVEDQSLNKLQKPSLENIDLLPLAERSAAKARNEILQERYAAELVRRKQEQKNLPGFRFETKQNAFENMLKTPEALSAKLTNLYAADASKVLGSYREIGVEQTNNLLLNKEQLNILREYAVADHQLDLVVDIDKLLNSVDRALTPIAMSVSATLEAAFSGLSVDLLPQDTFLELKSIGNQIARIKKDLDDPESQFLPQEDLIAKQKALKDLKLRADDLAAVLKNTTGESMMSAVSDLGLTAAQRSRITLDQMSAALALSRGKASVTSQLSMATTPQEQQRLIRKAAGYESTTELLKFTATLDKSGFSTVAEALGIDLNKLSTRGKSLLKEFSGLAKYINILKSDSIELNDQAAVDKYLNSLQALARLTERVQMTAKQNTLDILNELSGNSNGLNLSEQLSVGVANGLANTAKLLKQQLSEAITNSGDVLDSVAIRIGKNIQALSSYQPLLSFFAMLADKAEAAIHGGIGKALEQVNKAFPDLKIDATELGKMDPGARKSLTDRAYNLNILTELQSGPLNEDQANVLNRLKELGPEKTIEEFAKVGKSLLESVGFTDVQLNTVALDGVQDALKFNTAALNANTVANGGKPTEVPPNKSVDVTTKPTKDFGNTSDRYDELFRKYAEINKVPFELVKAIAASETNNFSTKAVSSQGAVGIMQLMPTTAEYYGVSDRTDPEESISGGTRYLKRLMKLFPTFPEVAAAYNAGEGSVQKANAKAKASGGTFLDYLPKPKETVPYVSKVMTAYDTFAGNVAPPKQASGPFENYDILKPVLDKAVRRSPIGSFNKNLQNFIPFGGYENLIEPPPSGSSYEDVTRIQGKITLGKPFKPNTLDGGTSPDIIVGGINLTVQDEAIKMVDRLDSFNRMFGNFASDGIGNTLDKVRENISNSLSYNEPYDYQYKAEKIADQVSVNTNLPELKLADLPNKDVKMLGQQVDIRPAANELEILKNALPKEARTLLEKFNTSNKPLAGKYGDALGVDPKTLETLSGSQFAALDKMTQARANVQQQLTEGLGTKGYDASAATQALKNLDDQINSFVVGVNANIAELKLEKAGAYTAANKDNITGFLNKFSSIGTEVTGMMNEADKATAKSMAIQKLYLEDKLAKDSIAGKSTQETSKQLADLADAEGYLKDKTLEAANAAREAGKTFAESLTSTFKDAFKGLLNRESDKGKSIFKTFADKLITGIKDQTVDIFTNAVTDSIGLGKGGVLSKMLSKTGTGLSSGFRALGGGVQSLLSGKGSWEGFTSGVSNWFSNLTSDLDNATPEEIQMAAATKFSDAVDRFAGGSAISGAANAATGSGIGGALMSALPWVGGAAGVAGLGYMATKGGDWSSGLKDLGANFTTKAGSALTPSGNPMETLDPRTGLFGKMDSFDADVTGLFNNKSSSNKNGWSAGLSDSLAKSTPDTTGLWDIIMKPIKWFFSLIGDGFTGIMSFFTGAGQGVGTSSGKPESATSPLDSLKLKFANGGPVSGGGTTTSDSIPAMLSDGEFVVNAKATKENREMLERINRGEVIKRSLGGIVSMGTSLAGRAIGGKTGTALSSLGSIASGVAGMLSSQQAEQAAESLLAASQHLETAATALENFAATGSMGGGAGGFGGLNGSTIGLNGIPEGMTNFSRQTGMEGATTQGIADTSGYGATPGLTPISSVGMGDLSASGGMVGGGGGMFDGIFDFFSKLDFGKMFGSLGSLFGLGAATGGHIVGPGSGTSDSIPANLSNGEFVVNAAATKGNLGLLHSINAGKKVQHRALGGLLTMIPGLVGGIGGMIKGGGGGGAGGIMGMISQLLGPLMKLFGGGAGGGGIMSLFGGTKAATGGKIVGPGSGTSDSIPAMISNGEFVVNAAATKANLGLLHSLNSGRQHFAEGGLAGVSSGIMTTPTSKGFKPISVDKSTKSTQQVVNLNITGDISRQTKSEIFKMMPTIASGVNLQNKEAGIKR